MGKFVGTPPAKDSLSGLWKDPGSYWEVDQPILSKHGIIVYYQNEYRLMRIDGLDEEITEEGEIIHEQR